MIDLCKLPAVDALLNPMLYGALRRSIDSESKWFEVIEIKGGHIYPEAKPRFKAAWERYGSIFQFSMIQKQKTGWVKILGDA